MAFRPIRMIFALWLATAGALQAQTGPVVVELFTSQGCSSCPPADALLTKLADREDVIALALHVDYWDYIGWADTFGDPANTLRQKAYARAANKRMIYTPQIIVGGRDHVVGHEEDNVNRLLAENAARPVAVALTLERVSESLQISAGPAPQGTGEMDVQLVRYIPEQTVSIRRGENAGRDIVYSNIVTSWQLLRKWDGKSPLSISATVQGDEPVVVILQQSGNGPIVAAARLR